MSARHYTVISQGDDFDDLLPPADIVTTPKRRGANRCLVTVAAISLLVATVVAIALPMALIGTHRAGGHLSLGSSWGTTPAEQQTVALENGHSSFTTKQAADHNSGLTASTSTGEATKPVSNVVHYVTNGTTAGVTTKEIIAPVKTTPLTPTTPKSTPKATTKPPAVTAPVTPVVETAPPTQSIASGGQQEGSHGSSEPEAPDGGPSWKVTSSSGAEGHQDNIEESSFVTSSRIDWLKSITSDPAFVPAAIVFAVIIVLVAMVTAHALKRRADRKTRRRHLGRMVTDLQAGDKVTLMSSDDD